MVIVIAVVEKFGVSMASVHGDSSSFYVHGEYDAGEGESAPDVEEGAKAETPIAQETLESEFVPIEIVRGYSRDHRRDLKQFTLNLITSSDGDIPLGIRVGNGNEVDSQVLVPFMKQWRESWENLEAQPPQVMAADAALFTAENLSILGKLTWISRVPASIAEAQRLMRTQPLSQFQPFANPALKDYRYCELGSWYGGGPAALVDRRKPTPT